MPTGVVVSAPSLRIARNTDRPSPADGVRPVYWMALLRRLEARPCHQEGMDRAHVDGRERLAVAVDLRRFVPKLGFVVVVPRRVEPRVQDLRLHLMFPPVHGLRIGEI